MTTILDFLPIRKKATNGNTEKAGDKRKQAEKRISEELAPLSVEGLTDEQAQEAGEAVQAVLDSMRAFCMRRAVLDSAYAKSPAEVVRMFDTFTDALTRAKALGVIETAVYLYGIPRKEETPEA